MLDESRISVLLRLNEAVVAANAQVAKVVRFAQTVQADLDTYKRDIEQMTGIVVDDFAVDPVGKRLVSKSAPVDAPVNTVPNLPLNNG